MLTLAARAQTTTLLNISDSTYPTACTVGQYQAVGVAGLTGTETISQYSPAFLATVTSPMTFTNGGQKIYMSSTAGAYAKNTGPGNTPDGGLLDLYLYNNTATAITMSVSNLNLTPNTTYTLTLIGTVPNNSPAEDGQFTPLNTNPHIIYTSTTSGHGVFTVQFTTSAAYINTDTLNFTWARYAPSGDGVFDGLTIVPAANNTSTNAYLTSLALSPAGAVLTPGFATNRFNYWAANIFGTTLAATVTNADLTATNQLILNGSQVGTLASGVPSAALTLNVGATNVVQVLVMAQDGLTTNLYTVNVVEPPNANANLYFANVDLSQLGWRLWPDTNASWANDTLYLPSDVVLSSLPVNPPTGGWGVLNNSQGIAVPLPSSVEQYYWAAFGGTAFTGDYSGVAWWWKTFSVPVLQPGQRLTIKFRAARLRAEVYCNQKLCGYNIINEVPFEADVTSAVVPGATTNLLAVRITSPGGNLDWVDYGYMTWGSYSIPLSRGICGLDAGIVLEVCDPVAISDLAVFNDPNPNQVMLVGAVTNSGALAYNGPLNLTIQDSNSIAIWQATNTISVPAGTLMSFTNFVLLPNATLWDITNPVLYQASAVIPADTNSAMNVNFGFRWFSPEGIGTNALFRLNGRRIVLRSAIS